MGFLTEAVERVRRELDRNPLPEGTLLLRTQTAPSAIDFEASLRRPGVSVVAEVKRASPSAGRIAETDPGAQAAAYEAGGASAISVLTEPRHFDGTIADLRLVRAHTALPVLRKDFIVHPSQILEARANGADAVLLIVAALSDAEIRGLLESADDLGMAALVETHTEEEARRAVDGGARVIGVNSRDLESLEVDLDHALGVLAELPPDRVRVLESGVGTRGDVERAAGAGADAVLVGEALMRAADPAAALRELLGT
ncbi:MAG TPA: indole-3-glycerol phosphate synthase TrpC [Actinomycetota bacterium]|nr:indole-3-glycerol phosphate synthase TrpC [Actinomycetota bacterium]